ncbi:MAG: PQQ-binding-like beta-propeller repeat protein [Planctomycetota bacterium]
MALRGDLASVDLAQVFQMLALNKKVGLLSIQSSKLWKILYFDQRGVTVHHNVHSVLDRVVAAYLRQGRLTPESVDEVRDHAVRMAQPLAESLLAGGYLDSNELDSQYRLELEEEVYDLFFCREAKFEFHENATSIEGFEGSVDERFFFNCDSVIMEAARRIDEWAYICERVPSTAEVLVATSDDIDEQEFGGDGLAIFDMLDGRRNVARVIETTGMANFLVCKTLSQLLDAGHIAPVDPSELVDLGNECMEDDRVQDAISLYERAIELGLGLPDSHALAAKAYLQAREYELASFHMESEAEIRIGSGDLKGAARVLLEVKELLPTNLQARERLIELTLGPGTVKLDAFDALAEGKELVDLLTEFGDIERVRALLERLLMVEPNDPDLKKALVNVHLRAGDQKRVVQLYESIAEDLVRNGKPLEAVSYLQKILLIDRSRSDISERVRRLYEFDERTRRRSRALGVLAVMFCLLSVLGAGYWFYNERAKEDFAAIDVTEMLATNDFAGARRVYEEFLLDHPLTTSLSNAQSELKRIEASIEKFEARRASERAERLAALVKLRKGYQREWARHREQFLGGSPEVALEAVLAARGLIEQAGQPDDIAWALEQQVERTYKHLEEFLARSRELGKTYDSKIVAQDWLGARQAALELHKDYENTADGQRVMVPVMVETRPPGATLMHQGKPLMRSVDGVEEKVTTPGLVLCRATEPVRLTAVLDGFAPRDIAVDGRRDELVDVVLEVRPAQRLQFSSEVQTGLAVGGGTLALGLRGGKLGLARTDGSNLRELELGGLTEVDSDPVVSGGRVFFVSNENKVEARPIEDGVSCRGWPVSLGKGAATQLVAGHGRVALIDVDNVLHCWEQSTARRTWGAALGGACAGPPTIVGRRAFVGMRDGRVIVFDVANGNKLGVLRSPAGISTRVLADGGLLWFGCDDQQLRAVDFEAGRVLWSHALGRVPGAKDLALTDSAVLIAASGRVVSIDRSTGEERGSVPTDGKVLDIRAAHRRGVVRIKRQGARQRNGPSVLVAIDARDASIIWEYPIDAKAGSGSCALTDLWIALPGTAGEVVLFR